MMDRMSWGTKAMIKSPILILMNANRSYPVQRVPDESPGLFYCSTHKGCMDFTKFTKCSQEPGVIEKLLDDERKVLFVEIVSDQIVDTAKIQAL